MTVLPSTKRAGRRDQVGDQHDGHRDGQRERDQVEDGGVRAGRRVHVRRLERVVPPEPETYRRDRASPKRIWSSPKMTSNRRALYRESQKIPTSSPNLASPISWG